jgi:DNA polymerase-3 subunit gamma/tau
MSYIVLARKWRPQGFEDLVGQESVVKTFKNALSSEKIAHAYLFSGPRGVGKTSSARILAKALNCAQIKDSEPCGKCQSCVSITEGSSVDVFEIDGASNTSVDAVRELRETVKYAPSGGKYRIYIIDEVHMLSTAAFNALLKTLEEPPAHVVFIFATTEPKKIPSTILSRCQHHSFRRITKAEIRDQLKKITDTEKINIMDTALEMIAKAADGSMRDGLTLLDQACSFTDNITEKELQSLLGLPETEVIINLSKTILTGDISSTLSIIKELTDRGSDLRQITKELVELFRNIAVIKITGDAGEILEFSQEEVQSLSELSSGVNIEQMTLLLTELLKLDGEVRNAINPRYTLELGLLRTSFVKGMTSIENVLKMLENPETTYKTADEQRLRPAPPKSSAPAAEKKTEVIHPQPGPAVKTALPDKEELWNKLLENVDSEDHRLSLKLAEAKPIKLTSTEFSIGFNGGMSVLSDSIKSKASVIKPILQKISGQNLKFKILALPKEKTGKDNKDLKGEILSKPLVTDALKIFSGSLLKVRSLENNKSTEE